MDNNNDNTATKNKSKSKNVDSVWVRLYEPVDTDAPDAAGHGGNPREWSPVQSRYVSVVSSCIRELGTRKRDSIPPPESYKKHYELLGAPPWRFGLQCKVVLEGSSLAGCSISGT